MARPQNPNRTVKLEVMITQQVESYLKSLVSTGLYGQSIGQAANHLICEKLREDLRAKRIRMLDPKPEEEEIIPPHMPRKSRGKP